MLLLMLHASAVIIKWGDIQNFWKGGESYMGDLVFYARQGRVRNVKSY